MSSTDIFRILIDNKNVLYAAAGKAGIFKIGLSDLTAEVLPVTVPESDGAPVNIRDIIKADSCFWLGSYGYGLLKYLPGKGVVESFTTEDPSLKNNFEIILRMVAGPYPDLWISAWDNYLYRFNLKTHTSKAYTQPFSRLFPGTNSYDMLMQGADSLWMGTTISGLQLFHIKEERLELIPNKDRLGINEYHSIVSLFRSDDGILWAGTNGNGLDYHYPGLQLFEAYSKNSSGANSMDVEEVRCIWGDEKYLFTGGYNGLNRINRKTLKRDYFLSKEVIFSIAPHPSDPAILILGDQEGKLTFFDKEKGHIRQYDYLSGFSSQPKLMPCSVNEISPANDHELLLATALGLFVFDLDRLKMVRQNQSSDPSRFAAPTSVRSILIDRGKRTWVGSTTDGLYQFNAGNGAFTRYDSLSKPYYFPTLSILSLLEDSSGRLWAGTDNGLMQFEADKGWIKTISTKDGLINNYIVGMVEDSMGNLWLSTKLGLTKYYPASGDIYFGGNEGLVAFLPQKLDHRLPHPRPQFVNKMQGEFTFSSSLGHGSRFNFTLPEI